MLGAILAEAKPDVIDLYSPYKGLIFMCAAVITLIILCVWWVKRM
jgi:hypothetical protein